MDAVLRGWHRPRGRVSGERWAVCDTVCNAVRGPARKTSAVLAASSPQGWDRRTGLVRLMGWVPWSARRC